ncbi:MFS general substrate transporter [Lindgomyces ingoldianus]|uniref:MFS general substrate transporter n=1 Tax=Lindgomyces ingoldianus TaxID=673940 RepID=A0ACB6QUQ2_9PLEO|nr:MFS general substrate transporter [Lindgomyces ingoldianus]KAF2470754.1 MFS general substrate transporter [Lindgomyces ingoldianus]
MFFDRVKGGRGGYKTKNTNEIVSDPLLSDVDEEGERQYLTESLPDSISLQPEGAALQNGEVIDLDALATQYSVFDNPEIAKLYEPGPDYEGRHRYNPALRWTLGEELAILRKIDWRILSFVSIIFMALELDRANVSQALTDNFLQELSLTTDDYNLGNTVSRLAFLCAELPSQLISKWLGANRWIAIQVILWSLVAASQCALSGRASYLACRILIALLQGGFIPNMILYLSNFYTSRELPIRLSLWWTAMSCADIVASLLGFGLLHLRGIAGISGWRWLFFIEGILSGIIGVMSIFLLPQSPTQTAGFLRGREGWFSKREETIIVMRLLRDDPSKGTLGNKQPITLDCLFNAMLDYQLWPLYIIGLFFQVPMLPSLQYLTIRLRSLGFETFQTNLLVIPSQIGHIIAMLGLTRLSERTKKLSFTAMLSQLWALPFLLAIYALDPSRTNKWVMWAVLTLLLSYPNPHAIQAGWISRNSGTGHTRAVSAALYNMFAQFSVIIASNIYREDDSPRYQRGNRVLLLILCFNVVLYVCVGVYYTLINRRRDAIWKFLNQNQRIGYLQTTKDEGCNKLDFRFAL